jgi:microcompartment protein CcmK/EutM
MIFAKVIGQVVSTQKEENLTGKKLLLCKETDASGLPLSAYHVAVDAVGAGEGDFVLIATGSAARMTEQTVDTPVDAVIMAIIDSVELDPSDTGKPVRTKGKKT